MKKPNIDKKLEKWCKKQAKKLQKQQAKSTEISTSMKFMSPVSNATANLNPNTRLQSKKAQRKYLSQLLSDHLTKQHIKHLDKPALKKQLKLAKAQFIAANDASFLSSAVIKRLSPSPTGRSFALRPYKKSPCSGCPALKGRLCKCALKAMQKRQAS
ncbi:hypothetical protein [Shewanella sp. CG12_big_fil_rev_8_21_14_0_65_47_15]|uniref:hypothetical protein n=1 Tax=Shewanella sp. CG12_big_fil_rev_8_21_14_0_65_47_15 TaxID=1975537 RepID=UPI000CAE911A|nr:hypothetical protein [Shewanella sp. CG12_big_fil_rev_8_21_14_0_65_47_15]PIW61194.1 MAG: hypothetical protein COW15_09380 [Shewanella sp. CG12_big_fil_rev_8_21_14_0_65_47_15]